MSERICRGMIAGVQKLSLVDYPKIPSYVIFLGGCNFRCPFCHNKGIVEQTFPSLQEEDVLAEIRERIGFLNAVVVTGGEPTIYGTKLLSLLRKLRETGLKIKLDSNGTNPKLLHQILEEQLVDYIAMDVKGTWARYSEIAGVPVSIQAIKESIYLLEHSTISYEFRTTVCKEFHTSSDLSEIKSYFQEKSPYYLQPYQYSDQQIKNSCYTPYSKEELKSFEEQFQVLVKQ